MSDNLMEKNPRSPNLNYSSDMSRNIEMPSIDEYAQAKPQMQANQEQPVEDSWEVQTDNNEMHAFAPVPDTLPEDLYQAIQGPDLEEPDNGQDDVEAEAKPINKPVKKSVSGPSDSPAANRIRELKEANRRSEREKEEMAKQLQQFQFQQMQLQQMQNKQNQQQQVIEEPEEDIDIFNLDDDSLAEAKDLKKMYQEMRVIKKELNMHKERTIQEQMRSQQELAQAKLLANYPDFYSVCSKENLAVLEAMQPELAETILSNQNKYSQMVTAYTMVKQFGIDKEYLIENDRSRVIKNNSKPRPMNSIRPQQREDTPLTHANSYAQGDGGQRAKDREWQLMQEAIRNH